MKRTPSIICIGIYLMLLTNVGLQPAHGWIWQYTDSRETHKGASVRVHRLLVQDDEKIWASYEDAENRFVYGEPGVFERLVPAINYKFLRNCHDYAWAPFMDCMCWTPDEQKEAWWMEGIDMQFPGEEDPSISVKMNWSDGSAGNRSMEQVVQSVMTVLPPLPPGQDYLFNTAELDSLPWLYQDIFGEYVPLPTCPLDSLDDIPAHSAILVDWFTPSGQSSEYSAGIFVSKWGKSGLYRHRWGPGFCPRIYCEAITLRIFAPTWDPLFVIHTPW